MLPFGERQPDPVREGVPQSRHATAFLAEAEHEGWALVALDLGVDLTTPSGEVMAHVLAAIAQFERRLIGQRTKDALAVKRPQGVRLGRVEVLPTSDNLSIA